jgi:hypothetical protein
MNNSNNRNTLTIGTAVTIGMITMGVTIPIE